METTSSILNKGHISKPFYEPSVKKSLYTVNGVSFHVYEARKENIFTYIGYYFRLIFMKNTWKAHSIKIDNHVFKFLAPTNKIGEISQLEKSALKAQMQATKIQNPLDISNVTNNTTPLSSTSQDIAAQQAPETPQTLPSATVKLEQPALSKITNAPITERTPLPEEWLRPPYTVDGRPKDIACFCEMIEKFNLTAEVKINIKKTSDGEVQLCHSKHEINSLVEVHPELHDFFFIRAQRTCFGTLLEAHMSRKGLFFIPNYDEKELSRKLEEQYTELSHQKLTEIVQPEIENFSGQNEEIEKIFTSLLSQSNGLVIGELHDDLTPKEILIDQMKSLYDQGVRTLFLEHCCYDTLQESLDHFYESKKPSEFIKKFLQNGCGDVVGQVNYYELVNAAVLAGIRPVGLELSSTQGLGYHKETGSQGKDRCRGMNVPAKEIIEQEKGEGKFIALVGSGHVSYWNDIAGLSELCGVPAMVISDKEKETNPPTYDKNQEHLGFDMNLPENIKIFNNTPGMVHFTHAHLTCAPKEKISG